MKKTILFLMAALASALPAFSTTPDDNEYYVEFNSLDSIYTVGTYVDTYSYLTSSYISQLMYNDKDWGIIKENERYGYNTYRQYFFVNNDSLECSASIDINFFGQIWVYLNGTLIYNGTALNYDQTNEQEQYTTLDLPKEVLRKGANVLTYRINSYVMFATGYKRFCNFFGFNTETIKSGVITTCSPKPALLLETDKQQLFLTKNGNYDTLRIGAKLFTEDGPRYDVPLKWTSSNPEAVTVDSTGLIEAVSVGNATITVSSEINDTIVNASCFVTVNSADEGKKYVYVSIPGTLDKYITKEDSSVCIGGYLNRNDLDILHSYSGSKSDVWGFFSTGIKNAKLAVIDLSNAIIQSAAKERDGNSNNYNDINCLPNCLFYGATALKSVTIPSSVTQIDWYDFKDCSSLTELCAPNNNPKYLTVHGVLYSKTDSTLLCMPQGKRGAWITPSFLTSLPDSALKNSHLNSVTLSAEIDSIGAGAFSGCSGLKSLLVQTTDVPQTATDAFNGVGKGTTIVFVPTEAVDAYKADETWGAFRMLQAFPTEAYIYLSDSTLTLYDTQSPEPRQKDISAIVVTPQGASDAQITWTASNDSVITVSDGHVELLQPGSATITASALVGDTTIFSTCSVLGVGFEAGQSVYYIATPGTLIDVIPQVARDTITNLKLFGYINGTDLREIRRMAGGELNYDATNTNAKLTILDLGDVIIRSGGDTYHVGSNYGLSYWEQKTGDNGVNGGMFYTCWKLEKVVLPQTLFTLGNATFADCTNLQSVTMPKNTTYISDNTFLRCSNLTEINNVDWASLDSINSYSFERCSSLQSIGDLSACTSIGFGAFENCTSLQSIGDLSACTSIGFGAFENCTSLQSIGDLSACTSIGGSAFSNCKSLQSIGDLKACTTIEDLAFENCDSLKSIRLYDVKNISDKAFLQSGIDEVHIIGTTPATLGGTNIIDINKQVVVVPAAVLDTYRTAEKWSSFYQNIVPDDAQLDVTAEVTAEDGGSGILTAIGDKAASYLTRLTLKGSINSYDFMLFRNKMPNLHYLDLTETTIEANPYEFVTGCYTEINRLPILAFKDFSKLLEIKLPNSITFIGISAFLNCINLRAVTTYPGIVTVDASAFSGCTSLKQISFEKGLSGINEGAFSNCTSLKHISLPEGLLSIKSAFYRCSFDSIAIPSTVTEIGSSAFYQCNNLKYISLSKNLTKINGYTFAGCSSLQSIVLPSKVTSIDAQAFYGCSNLKELRIPPMVEIIGDEAFKDCPIKDVYVYVANSKDVAINQNTFSCWSTATLHVPDFATASYYWNTQWSQFVNITEFSDTYESFYTKNDITLDSETGTIKGTPDATLHEESGLIVNDDEKQDLGDVELIHDGENGASVIPEKEGNITANRARIRIHVTANRWHFFCFPFDIDLDSLQYDGQYVWRQYDGLRRSRREGGWQNLPEGTTRLTKWRGYIFQGTTTGDLVLTVVKPDFTSKDVDSHLEVYTSDNAVDASWNFVGNPYQSYYSIDQTSYDAPITVWTGSGYEAYRPGDDDYEFSPYQAFFVQTSEDNDAVGFRAGSRESYLESQQSLAKARAFRSAQYVKPDRLLFNLTLTHQGDSTYTDRTRIVFNDRKSLAYEVGCDAAKFFSTQRSAELFSTDAQGTQYSINERPVGEGRVDLSLVVNKAGIYSISGERMDAPALLIDNLSGVSHDLTLGAYEFSATEGTLSNRFTLVLRDDLTGIESITAKTGAQISLHNGVSISGVDSGVQTRLFSIDGRLAGSITGQGTIAAPEGVYILRVGAMSTKIKIE